VRGRFHHQMKKEENQIALIGTIAINMTARTEQVTRAMNKAAAAVSGFGAVAAKSVGGFGAQMADAGRATAGVVNQFYVKPFMKAARVIGGVGKEIGASLGWAAKGVSGPFNRAGNVVAGFTAMLGRNLLQVGIGGAVGGFRLLTKAAGASVRVLRESANVLGRGAAIGAGIAAVGLYKAARAASSLAEQTDRAKNTFGPASAEMIKQANAMAGAFGISKSMFLNTASGLGSQFQGLGYADKDAVALGIHLTKLGLDAKSRFQIPVEEAMDRMRSAIAGESESVRKWGVNLDEANLKIKAQAMGMKILGGQLTQAQKAQVRVVLIEERFKNIQGDLAKTAGSAENATMGLMGRLENLAATIGTAFLPIVGSAMVELQTGVEALSMTWQAWTKGVVNDQVGVVGSVGETAGAMGLLQKSVGFVADSFQALKIGFYLTQSYITSGIAQIVDGFAVLGKSLDWLLAKVGKSSGIGEFLNTYSADLKRISESQYASYQNELTKNPASDSVNAAFAAAQARIKGMQAEAMAPGVDVTKLAPKSEAVEKKAAEPKFASAAEAGSKEAANAILQSRYGSTSSKGPADVTARNTTEANRYLARIAAAVGANAGASAGSALASIF
jgi:hypothetical protein